MVAPVGGFGWHRVRSVMGRYDEEVAHVVLFRRLLGDVLRRHRQRQGRTLRDVAADARVSLGYLSEVERGLKEASSELLTAVCDALGVSLADVLREISDDLLALERRPLASVGFGPSVGRRPAAAVASVASVASAAPVASVASSASVAPPAAAVPAGVVPAAVTGASVVASLATYGATLIPAGTLRPVVAA